MSVEADRRGPGTKPDDRCWNWCCCSAAGAISTRRHHHRVDDQKLQPRHQPDPAPAAPATGLRRKVASRNPQAAGARNYSSWGSANMRCVPINNGEAERKKRDAWVPAS